MYHIKYVTRTKQAVKSFKTQGAAHVFMLRKLARNEYAVPCTSQGIKDDYINGTLTTFDRINIF